MVNEGNRRYHDRVAARYDDVYDTPYWRFYREVSWRHLRAFLPTRRPAHAADLGCGTGWFGCRLLKAGFDLTFVDPSQRMLEQARRAVAAVGERGRTTTFVQAGLEDLAEIADRTLDFATAQGDPLSFCQDPSRALRELARVCAPGALVVLSVDSRVAGVRSLQDSRQPDQLLELLRTGRTAWQGDQRGERFAMKMFDPVELDGLLRHAGFEPLSRIAKTCVVQRQHDAWLEDRATHAALLAAEESVHALPHWFGLAGHFQVAARRSPDEA
jgi:ubiquinone/menaquinone biosynthesis C-methylase UbiE